VRDADGEQMFYRDSIRLIVSRVGLAPEQARKYLLIQSEEANEKKKKKNERKKTDPFQ
jgi:hypothetical protein